MKKSLLLPLLTMVFGLWTSAAIAQCTPDPVVTDPEGNGEMVPDTLEGWEGTPMDLTLSIICPATADVGAGSIPLHHITIKSITNKPAWMSYACNPGTCEYAAGVLQCALVTGTPPAGSAGTTTMDVLVDVYANMGGTPIQVATDYNGGMPLVLIIHPAANVEEIGNTGFGLIPAQPNPFNNLMRIGCYSSDRRTCTLNIVDMVGNIIYTEKLITEAGNNYFTFSGANLTNGIYFYTIKDDRGNVVTRKMMKSE